MLMPVPHVARRGSFERGVSPANCVLLLSCAAASPTSPASPASPDMVQDVRIACNSNEIAVSIGGEVAPDSFFDGMVYPRGLSKNSSCLAEFRKHKGPLRYRLPLRSCNTMSTDLVSSRSKPPSWTAPSDGHRESAKAWGIEHRS